MRCMYMRLLNIYIYILKIYGKFLKSIGLVVFGKSDINFEDMVSRKLVKRFKYNTLNKTIISYNIHILAYNKYTKL